MIKGVTKIEGGEGSSITISASSYNNTSPNLNLKCLNMELGASNGGSIKMLTPDDKGFLLQCNTYSSQYGTYFISDYNGRINGPSLTIYAGATTTSLPPYKYILMQEGNIYVKGIGDVYSKNICNLPNKSGTIALIEDIPTNTLTASLSSNGVLILN